MIELSGGGLSAGGASAVGGVELSAAFVPRLRCGAAVSSDAEVGGGLAESVSLDDWPAGQPVITSTMEVRQMQTAIGASCLYGQIMAISLYPAPSSSRHGCCGKRELGGFHSTALALSLD